MGDNIELDSTNEYYIEQGYKYQGYSSKLDTNETNINKIEKFSTVVMDQESNMEDETSKGGTKLVKFMKEIILNMTSYNSDITDQEEDEDEEEEEEKRKKYDNCPMDGSEIFQMKMFWKKGIIWQDSKKEKAWCLQCKGDCEVNDYLQVKQCDEDDQKQYWVFEDCMVKPILKPNLCMTTGKDPERTNKGEHQGKIMLKRCNSKYKKNQQFRSYDTDDIFTKFNFKILSSARKSKDRRKDDRICLSTEHHPRSGETLRFFSCEKAYENDSGKKDDSSHWVVGEFDGH